MKYRTIKPKRTNQETQTGGQNSKKNSLPKTKFSSVGNGQNEQIRGNPGNRFQSLLGVFFGAHSRLLLQVPSKRREWSVLGRRVRYRHSLTQPKQHRRYLTRRSADQTHCRHTPTDTAAGVKS